MFSIKSTLYILGFRFVLTSLYQQKIKSLFSVGLGLMKTEIWWKVLEKASEWASSRNTEVECF